MGLRECGTQEMVTRSTRAEARAASDCCGESARGPSSDTRLGQSVSARPATYLELEVAV